MKYIGNGVGEGDRRQFEGDGRLEITGSGCTGTSWLSKDLIYVEGSKHIERALASSSACVIAPKECRFQGKAVLRSAKPKVSFAKAAALLRERPPVAAGNRSDRDRRSSRASRDECRPRARMWLSVKMLTSGTEPSRSHAVIGAGCWIGEGLPYSSTRDVLLRCARRPSSRRFIRGRCWGRTDLDLRSTASAIGNFRRPELLRLRRR